MTIESVDCKEHIAVHSAGHTGGERVFQAIDEGLGDPDGSLLFLLQAPPGAGKTAVAGRPAQLSLDQAAQRGRLIQRLAPLVTPNPTVINTLLARLLLARQLKEAAVLDGLDEIVAQAVE